MAALPGRLAGQGTSKNPIDRDEFAAGHTGRHDGVGSGDLSVLALVVLFSKVHPFGAVTAEPIAVDIVTAREIENKPEPVDPPKPTTDLSVLAKPVADAARRDHSQRPRSQRPPRNRPRWLLHGRIGRRPLPRRRRPMFHRSPIFRSSITCCSGCLRISVAPPTAAPPSGDRPGDNFDAPANKAADVAPGLVAQFRRHLKTCSKLPELADGVR